MLLTLRIDSEHPSTGSNEHSFAGEIIVVYAAFFRFKIYNGQFMFESLQEEVIVKTTLSWTKFRILA
jgi:hypothetical protein